MSVGWPVGLFKDLLVRINGNVPYGDAVHAVGSVPELA
jgi:hypothetical protein